MTEFGWITTRVRRKKAGRLLRELSLSSLAVVCYVLYVRTRRWASSHWLLGMNTLTCPFRFPIGRVAIIHDLPSYYSPLHVFAPIPLYFQTLVLNVIWNSINEMQAPLAPLDQVPFMFSRTVLQAAFSCLSSSSGKLNDRSSSTSQMIW